MPTLNPRRTFSFHVQKNYEIFNLLEVEYPIKHIVLKKIYWDNTGKDFFKLKIRINNDNDLNHITEVHSENALIHKYFCIFPVLENSHFYFSNQDLRDLETNLDHPVYVKEFQFEIYKGIGNHYGLFQDQEIADANLYIEIEIH